MTKNYGISQWLFLNRVISQLVSPYKSAFVFENDVDFERIVQHIQINEVDLRDKIQDRDVLIEKFRHKVSSLEETITNLENKLDEYRKEHETLRIDHTDLQRKYDNVRAIAEEEISAINSKLNDAIRISERESENAQLYHREAEQAKEKFEHEKKKLLEALAEEKIKIIKHENETTPVKKILTQPSLQIAKPEPHPSADNPPFIDTAGEHLDKEERRMFKALSKFTSPTNTANPSNPVPSTKTGRGSAVVGTAPTTSQSYRPPKTISNPNEIPEWKKRQMEKEQAEAEKLEQEQLKKLQALKNTPSVEIEPVHVDVEPEWKKREDHKVVAKPTTSQETLPLLSSQSTEMTEKELQRLEKTMNRYSKKV